MEKIWFRGKKTDNNEWVYGYYTQEMVFKKNGDIFIYHYIVDKKGDKEIVSHRTVGRYMDPGNQKFKDIYDGDIFELVNEADETIRVICKFGKAKRTINNILVEITGFYFLLPDGRKSFPIVDNYLGVHDLSIFKLVGNIHDNPDMCNHYWEKEVW